MPLAAHNDHITRRVMSVYYRLIVAASRKIPEIGRTDWKMNVYHANRPMPFESCDGGHVFAPTSRINELANDDQLAFLLSHEMAHSLCWHQNERRVIRKLYKFLSVTIAVASSVVLPSFWMALIVSVMTCCILKVSFQFCNFSGNSILG